MSTRPEELVEHVLAGERFCECCQTWSDQPFYEDLCDSCAQAAWAEDHRQEQLWAEEQRAQYEMEEEYRREQEARERHRYE